MSAAKPVREYQESRIEDEPILGAVLVLPSGTIQPLTLWERVLVAAAPDQRQGARGALLQPRQLLTQRRAPTGRGRHRVAAERTQSMTSDVDKVFAGSIPRLYEDYFVPLIFAPYADDLAGRVAARTPARVLEIAAGTGVVTRALAAQLPAATEIVATDLNPGMLETARAGRHVAAGASGSRPTRCSCPSPTANSTSSSASSASCSFPTRARLRRGAPRPAPGRRVPLQRLGPDRGQRVRRRRDERARDALSRRPAALHGAHAARLPRPRGDRARPARRRLREAGADRDGRGAEPGADGAPSGDRLLPGLAAAQRDRGARPGASRRGDRLRGGRDRAPLRRAGRSTPRSRPTSSSSSADDARPLARREPTPALRLLASWPDP